MTDEPPPAFLESERKHGGERRALRADDPFWDRAPETVEWRTYHGGSTYDVTRSREEFLEFAWPDGRTEAVGDKPYILIFTQYDSVTPDGRSQATRDTNFHAHDLPVRDLYAAYDPPPRWIGLLRQDELRSRDDVAPRETFQSYAVVEPPAPRAQPAVAPKTADRTNGSLEGTGWIKGPPGSGAGEPQGGGGLVRRLRGLMSG